MNIFKRWFGPEGDDNSVSKPVVPVVQSVPVTKGPDSDLALLRLIEATNLEDCLRAYTSTAIGSQLEQRAMDKVKKIARTFEDWRTICQSVSPTSSLGVFAAEHLSSTADTFENWHDYYLICSSDAMRSTVLDKMAAGAHSLEKQLVVYGLAPEGSSVRAAMFTALKSQAKNLGDWKELMDSSSGELEKIAAQMLIELTPGDISELKSLLSHYQISNDSELKRMVLDRARALKMSSDEWIKIINDTDFPEEIRDMAVELVMKDPAMMSKGFEGWEELLKYAEEGSDFEKHAAVMVVASVPINDPAVLVDLLGYSVIENDSKLNAKVIEKLKSIPATAFDKWEKLYSDSEDEEIKKISRDKMVEGIDSVERLVSMEEAIDEDDQDDDFDKLIKLKARVLLVTDEACKVVTDKYYADGVLFVVAFEYMLGKANSLRECFELFTSLHDEWKQEDDEPNGELVEKVTEKMLSLATGNEMFLISMLGEERDEYVDLANAAEKLVK